jgi:hypothetical protein
LFSTRKKIGDVAVDAGLMLVGDPSYYVGKGSEVNKAFRGWDQFLAQQRLLGDAPAAEMKFSKGHAGLGVVVATAHGDGMYPVYLVRDSKGAAKELVVKLQ